MNRDGTGVLPDDLRSLGFELRETHISWVFLGSDEVFKVKKPVDLGFLDFSTEPRRRVACESEVELNRRLAPDVYLGISAVTRDHRGCHSFDGDGEVVDWAVRMKRLPDSQRADILLRDGRLRWEDLARLAALLADFHRGAATGPDVVGYGSVASIKSNVQENFRQTKGQLASILAEVEAEAIERQQLDFIENHANLFEARCATGRVRDGHGDLRLEHVYVDQDNDMIRILDCIEFNERFRYADVCSDVAFLAMDLAWSGQVDLSERFLAAYARAADDFDLYPLIDFYESYRAFVRGKIASIVIAHPHTTEEARERLRQDARRYFLLSLAAERRPLRPARLVAVGGVIASGKSTVADSLAAKLACPVIDSDRTRKHLLGVGLTDALHDAPFVDAYDPAITEQVYSEIGRRASAVLSTGRSVVIDASFRARADRVAMRDIARTHGASFTLVECRGSG